MNANDTGRNHDGPLPGEMVQHGTGVTSNRAFPTSAYQAHLDPFVLFERFYIEPDVGFPTHPHRGFEIVSYMLEGGMEHEDSLGVANTAYENDVMRITTGRGIRHSEFPADGRACNGLQLWVNLPQDAKAADPDYADATAADLPTETHGDATVTTVVGDGSPVDLHTPMEYLDVGIDGEWAWRLPDGWSGFLYGVAGDGTVDDAPFADGDVLPVTDSRTVTLESHESLRVVAVAGRPHGEPITQNGPFVF